MKTRFWIAFVFCCVGVLCGYTMHQHSFKETEFDSVFIFESGFPPDGPFPNERKDVLGKTIDSANFKEKAFLTTEERTTLYDYLVADSSYKNGFAAICWEPHLGIYFLNKGKTVNYIEVCLDCNKLMSALKIKASEPYKLGKIYVPTGLTAKFRKFINSLLLKYKFEHTVNPDSPYDK